MIEVHPISAIIDSDLDSLADSLELALVERDSATPLTPTAQAWRALDQGDLIRVRLGLADLGYDNYGVFRVDECALDGDERSWRQRIHARDKAALLCDEKGAEFYGFRSYGGSQATEASNPTALHVASEIAARAGLTLEWDAPNYELRDFIFGADESASQAIGRLLEPLRQSRRYRADAWVEGEAGMLVVRRRGSGANAGAIDCSLGRATVIRARQPQVGDINVYGATYTYLTVYESQEKVLSTGTSEGGGEPKTSIRIVEESPTHRKTETGTVVGSVFTIVSRTIENHTYEDVTVGGRWLGRILRKTTVEEETNLSSAYPKRIITTTLHGYDNQWRLVLRDEEKRQRDQETGEPSIFVEHVITSYEQITPTDIRSKTVKVNAAGEQIGKADYQQSPGTLQSALHQNPSLADAQWQTNPDGTQPEQVKGQEYTAVYHGQADGGGTLPREYRNENLIGDNICSQIANDLAAESGKWLYTVRLIWPRPFSYRKGERVTLTNLPGDCPDLTDAIITRLHTTFDVEAAAWAHEVEIEAWRES